MQLRPPHCWFTAAPCIAAFLGADVVRGGDAVDGARKAPDVILEPGPRYADEVRMFQGIPGVERAPRGRLWATWYGGGVSEDRYNYVMLATSGDDGRTWSGLRMVVDPDGDGPCRAFDPCLWCDPSGRVWLFWSQRHRSAQLWATVTSDPDSDRPAWSAPRMICEGIMMCKPTVLGAGQWLLPVALWREEGSATVVASSDQGGTWATIGRANIPDPKDRNCDEAMIVERTDGSLWQLVRTAYGIGESVSSDGGHTWSDVSPSSIAHATARFFIRRLRSGRLLLVKHGPIDQRTDRSHLTAYVSADDGKSWEGGLLLDERRGVSYPDGAEGPDGLIYLIYDYSRTGAKQILMATFTEEDVLRGRDVSGKVRTRVQVNRATGVAPVPDLSFDPNNDGETLLEEPLADLRLTEGKTATFERGAALFSDRGYVVRDLPEALKGRRFVHSSIDRIRVVCAKPGVVQVLTPSTGRNRDSLQEKLMVAGFEKVGLPEFLLFGKIGGNVCSVFQKRLEAGEEISLGKWGVLVY